MFEILNVKIKPQPLTPIDLLDMFYGQSSIMIKGKDNNWYVIQDGNGADIVWEKLEEDPAETEKMIVNLNMENISDVVIIEDAVEVWCDNECGDQNQE